MGMKKKYINFNTKPKHNKWISRAHRDKFMCPINGINFVDGHS